MRDFKDPIVLDRHKSEIRFREVSELIKVYTEDEIRLLHNIIIGRPPRESDGRGVILSDIRCYLKAKYEEEMEIKRRKDNLEKGIPGYLTAFKQSGKYYTQENILIPDKPVHEIKDMIESGELSYNYENLIRVFTYDESSEQYMDCQYAVPFLLYPEGGFEV